MAEENIIEVVFIFTSHQYLLAKSFYGMEIYAYQNITRFMRKVSNFCISPTPSR